MDRVFRALADPERRKILDLLRAKDGRTLQELCRHFEMSRFGVMKHIRVLEWAGLVVVQADGRHSRHYLNPVPIQQIADRWIARYRGRMARALVQVKVDLEKEAGSCRSMSTKSSSRRRPIRFGKRSHGSSSWRNTSKA
jgi:DNA-binding transcriptional ArsR family regulator